MTSDISREETKGDLLCSYHADDQNLGCNFLSSRSTLITSLLVLRLGRVCVGLARRNRGQGMTGDQQRAGSNGSSPHLECLGSQELSLGNSRS